VSNPEINIGQDGTGNTQNNTFNFASTKSNQPIPSNMRQGSKNFVGREEELAEIHAKLQEGHGVIVCAVEGMGGVGKTELALQYATRYQQEYVARYWLSLREMGLAQAVVTMASPYLDLPESMQAASLDEQAAWYWQNWLPETGKLLVILDDVPNAESIPDLAMPIDPRVRVLVTTRERELNVGFESVPLDVLLEEKALELLRKIVGAAKVDKELVTVKEICKTLGYLPLGIELIGEYLSKNRFLTFAKLQERLNLADESIARERKYRFYGDRGVEAAIQLSWDDISNGSQRVAMLLGLFAPVEILWELVAAIGAKAEITEDELNEARGQLDSLHLIQPIDDECNFYKIHTLVREFFRAKLLKAEENHQFRQAFVTSLLSIAKQITDTPTQDLIARVSPIIPHLDILSREMLGDILNPEEDLFWAFAGCGRFYHGQGLYTLAEDSYLRCLKAVQEHLGEHNPSVATSINNLGVIYNSQGRYEEAEPLYKHALLLRLELLGENHPDVAGSINNLALLYKSQGRYKEAEPLLKQALSLWQEQLGENHLYVASCINNLAMLYELQGRYEESEPLYKQALLLFQELLGERHPLFATSINSLALLYCSEGRYQEAEPLLKQALSLRQELLGESHPDVAISINNLAELYRSQGRHEESELLYKQALSMFQELLGESHPDVATCINNLAELYLSQGRYEEAEPLYKQALSLSQELLGENHPDVATSMNNLAGLYFSQGRYKEAKPLYEKALLLRKEALGERHPYIAQSISNISALYYAQGIYEKAEPLLKQAILLMKDLLGELHPDVAGSLFNLAVLYHHMQRHSEAMTSTQNAIQIYVQTIGIDHPRTKAAMSWLLSIRIALNNDLDL
jgi:tetratricopeptide (TPR) repeat protein